MGEEQIYKTITMNEIKTWCEGTFRDYAHDRLLEIITGKYPLDEAREDVLSFRKKDDNESIC